MPLPCSAESGFGVMKWMLSQHAPDSGVQEPNLPSLSPETIPLNDFYLSGIISLRMSVSTIETYATTFERVKRISADCSSAECAGVDLHHTGSFKPSCLYIQYLFCHSYLNYSVGMITPNYQIRYLRL